MRTVRSRTILVVIVTAVIFVGIGIAAFLRPGFSASATTVGDCVVRADPDPADTVTQCRGAHLAGKDLHEADLRFADLRGADLRGADLTGALAYGADLRGADLAGARLTEADLSGADLRDTDLRGTVLRDVYLQHADIRGASLEGSYLGGATILGLDVRDTSLEASDQHLVSPDGGTVRYTIALGLPRGVTSDCAHRVGVAGVGSGVVGCTIRTGGPSGALVQEVTITVTRADG